VTALIAYLLAALYKHAHQAKYTLWHCLSLIAATLFEPHVTHLGPGRIVRTGQKLHQDQDEHVNEELSDYLGQQCAFAGTTGALILSVAP
jgi:hypothetical protein